MSIPLPINLCIVPSTARMSTRPVIYKYLFSKSPCRFSSAVHALVQRAHADPDPPVSSRIPSNVFNCAMYVGSASSVIISPIKTTSNASGRSAHRARRSRTSS